MDELDRKLLLLLEQDARLPMAVLGRRIGLSRTATLARVRHLESAGAIRGYHADIGDAVAGAANAKRLDAILDRINAWPETVRTTTYVVLARYLGQTGRR